MQTVLTANPYVIRLNFEVHSKFFYTKGIEKQKKNNIWYGIVTLARGENCTGKGTGSPLPLNTQTT